MIQLSHSNSTHERVSFSCHDLNGEALCRFEVHVNDMITSLQRKIAEEIAVTEQSLRIVLPNGRLLHPFALKCNLRGSISIPSFRALGA